MRPTGLEPVPHTLTYHTCFHTSPLIFHNYSSSTSNRWFWYYLRVTDFRTLLLTLFRWFREHHKTTNFTESVKTGRTPDDWFYNRSFVTIFILLRSQSVYLKAIFRRFKTLLYKKRIIYHLYINNSLKRLYFPPTKTFKIIIETIPILHTQTI